MAPRCLSMSYVCVLFNFNTLVYLRNAVLSLRELFDGEPGALSAAVSILRRGFEEIGFLIIVDHGVPDATGRALPRCPQD